MAVGGGALSGPERSCVPNFSAADTPRFRSLSSQDWLPNVLISLYLQRRHGTQRI